MIGYTIGSYRITGQLGEGGMGTVYRATDNIEREVAIKALHPQLLSDPSRLARFRSEAMALGRLQHPNIAGLYHLLEQEGNYFMVMEFVQGQTLEEVVRTRGALPPNLALALFCDALRGFEHAHTRGVIHRDIKPSNLMISTEGVVKITDFGIARMAGAGRMTQTGKLIGTLEYMSPEQVRGLDQDARSDIYSLGILLFELLTGRMPFSATTDYDIMRAHLEEAPPPVRSVVPSLPPELDAIITKALAKDPAQRFQSVAEMRQALEMVARQLPPAPPIAALLAPQTRQAEMPAQAPFPTEVSVPAPNTYPQQPAPSYPQQQMPVAPSYPQQPAPSYPPQAPMGTPGSFPSQQPAPMMAPQVPKRTASSNQWVLPVIGGLVGLLVLGSLASLVMHGSDSSDNTASNANAASGPRVASNPKTKGNSGGDEKTSGAGTGTGESPQIDVPSSIPGFSDSKSGSGTTPKTGAGGAALSPVQQELNRSGEAIGNVVGMSKVVNRKYKFGFYEQGCLFGVALQPGETISEGFNLDSGQTYAFIAGGDKTVKDVDVVLYDPDGRLVRKGSKGQAAAMVAARQSRAGHYKISVTLKSSNTSPAFVCLAALRKGAYDVPLSDMTNVLKGVENVSKTVFAGNKSGRLNRDANTWAFYGTMLKPAEFISSDAKPFRAGSRLLFAVGDSHIKDLAVTLYDGNGKLVKSSDTHSSHALLSTALADSSYAVGVGNNGTTPGFVMAFAVNVPEGSLSTTGASAPAPASSSSSTSY